MHTRQVRRLTRIEAAALAGALSIAAWAGGASLQAVAAPPRGEDPDWPCQQRLMPTLGAATFWPGAPAADVSWRDDQRVAALVARIVPRRVTVEAGTAEIAAFADGIAAAEEKKHLLELVFTGLFEETNRERSSVIERLKDLGHRQHQLADIATKAGEELRAIPADATGDAAARRADLEERVTFVTQAFQNTQRTMRYACEVPVTLEARLGRYAEALKGRL